jgi:hypothetical protein
LRHIFKSVFGIPVSRVHFTSSSITRSFEFFFAVFNSCDNFGVRLIDPVESNDLPSMLLGVCSRLLASTGGPRP